MTQSGASKPHLWGVLWAALQRGIGTLAQESLLPSEPHTQEEFGPFLLILEMKKSLHSPTTKKEFVPRV